MQPLTALENAFASAARARRLVWLTEPGGRYRVVEPYMIFRSSTGKRLFHFYQVGGYSAGGILRGWKNPQTNVFDSAEAQDELFIPRASYNPFNRALFPEVIFAAPTATGAVREPDAA